MYTDLRVVLRFTQTVAGRIDGAGALGVFSMEPSMHDEQTMNTMKQLTDVLVEVRDPGGDSPDADGELRVKGLAGSRPRGSPSVSRPRRRGHPGEWRSRRSELL